MVIPVIKGGEALIMPMGGELGLGVDIFLKPLVNDRFMPYNKKHHVLVDTGRSALYLALLGIIQQGGAKEAWLPRYCCDSIVLPFYQLGFAIHYYSMGGNLRKPAMLPYRINKGTFLFINYFGKKNGPIIKWLTEQSRYEDSFFIIEDNVQASLSTNLGQWGDFIINSYRKFLPQPDGALLAYDQPINFKLGQPDETFISAKLSAKLIRENRGSPESFLELLEQAENTIDYRVEPRAMSFLSRFIGARTDISEISGIRRRNWIYLQGLLASRKVLTGNITALFDELEDGEVPLGFPIKTNPEHRHRLRRFLSRHSIYCPVHWPLSVNNEESAFKDDLCLSRSILTLPLDQRINEADLDYLVDKLAFFYG